jgi:hypothetical protein
MPKVFIHPLTTKSSGSPPLVSLHGTMLTRADPVVS